MKMILAIYVIIYISHDFLNTCGNISQNYKITRIPFYFADNDSVNAT